jgi:Na+-translocating ferredoxin:NAD+ oxidoreductase RnfD subunit
MPSDALSNESNAASAPPADAARGGRPDPTRHFVAHVLGALFPFTAALALYGWRAAGLAAVLILCTTVAASIWRRIGRRGGALHLPHVLWLAVLLSLMLPPHLLAWRHSFWPALPSGPWTLVPAAALLLVMLSWLIGCKPSARTHPSLLAYLILAVLFGGLLAPRVVLRRARAFLGDVTNCVAAPGSGSRSTVDEAWVYSRENLPADAVCFAQTAAERLTEYTRSWRAPQGAWLSIEGLLRDAMPPLEDLVIGGHPGPIGGSSAIAVLIGGLFLIYRRVIDYRVPLLTVLAAYLALLILPVPVAVTDSIRQWMPIVLPRAHLGWAVVVTFANYQIMCSPILFTAFFLATSPAVCPANPRARASYAVMLGALTAACQLYLSCSLGPYVALLALGVIAPWLDERRA